MEYIYLSENVIDSDMCLNIIELFKNNPSNHFQGNFGSNNKIDLNFKNSIELTIPLHLQETIIKIISPYIKEYIELFPHFPNNNLGFEFFRIKEYKNDGLHFYKKHIDCSSFVKSTRLLAVLIYLNDVFEGGETVIYNSNDEIKIKPEQGKLLIFPANFCYPHEGLPPISNYKYLLASFLCFKCPPHLIDVKQDNKDKPSSKNNITISKLNK